MKKRKPIKLECYRKGTYAATRKLFARLSDARDIFDDHINFGAVDVLAYDEERQENLLICAIRNMKAKVALQLIEHGSDIHHRTINGATALMWAVKRQKKAIVEELISCGADVNSRSDSGITPLMIAAREGVPDILTLLLERGANASASDEKGHTALSIATEKNNSEAKSIIEMRLIKRQAARDLRDAETSMGL